MGAHRASVVALCCLLGCSFVLPTSPLAQQRKLDCSNTSALPQQDMNLCARRGYDAADAELNTVWQALRDSNGEGYSMDMLRDAQRAWILFRDAHCEATSAPYEGGSIQPLVHFSCLERTTADRTDQLRSFLEGP